MLNNWNILKDSPLFERSVCQIFNPLTFSSDWRGVLRPIIKIPLLRNILSKRGY